MLFWILNQKPKQFLKQQIVRATVFICMIFCYLIKYNTIKYNIHVPTLFPAKHRYYFVGDGKLDCICPKSGKGFFAYHTEMILRSIEHLCNHQESRFPDRPECVVKEGGADSCRLNYGKSNFANCWADTRALVAKLNCSAGRKAEIFNEFHEFQVLTITQ